MSNTHLKDKRLSLKAIGLLSVVLSLPDDWHYTVNGLVGIVKDGERAVNGALSELKENGYLRIEKLYPNKDGRSKIEYQYIFSETPQDLQNVPLEQDIQNVGLHNVGLQDVGLQNVGTYKYTNKPNTNNKNTNKQSKHKYGEFQHVLLTDKEHTHLLDLYGDSLDEHIKILDEYIETSGKKYKNHSLVIQKWVHDEWMKRNKDKPITLDSKFYAEQNTKTDKEVQDEFNRLRAQLFGA
nr:MAG TPA: Dna polymerase B [Caudoviricetes sp.]